MTTATQEKIILKDLQSIPWIGVAMARDLYRLKITSVDDLKDKDPQALYEALSEMDGVKHDICVLDTFASAVYYARTGKSRPWWEFSRDRKAGVKNFSFTH